MTNSPTYGDHYAHHNRNLWYALGDLASCSMTLRDRIGIDRNTNHMEKNDPVLIRLNKAIQDVMFHTNNLVL